MANLPSYGKENSPSTYIYIVGQYLPKNSSTKSNYGIHKLRIVAMLCPKRTDFLSRSYRSYSLEMKKCLEIDRQCQKRVNLSNLQLTAVNMFFFTSLWYQYCQYVSIEDMQVFTSPNLKQNVVSVPIHWTLDMANQRESGPEQSSIINHMQNQR